MNDQDYVGTIWVSGNKSQHAMKIERVVNGIACCRHESKKRYGTSFELNLSLLIHNRFGWRRK